MGILMMNELNATSKVSEAVQPLDKFNELSKARSKAIATDLDKQQDNFKSRLKD
jgi:hypothetical protein